MNSKLKDFKRLIDKYKREMDIVKERIEMTICQELKDLTGLKFFAYGETEENILFILDCNDNFGNITVSFSKESFYFRDCIIYDYKYEKIKDKIDNYFDRNGEDQ